MALAAGEPLDPVPIVQVQVEPLGAILHRHHLAGPDHTCLARAVQPPGEWIGTVTFPVANITKLAFGGEDLRTVYATTARLHLSPEALEAQPEAGDLFAFRADVPGVEVTPARP
jgi:sugar lactone lactonase YvrE